MVAAIKLTNSKSDLEEKLVSIANIDIDPNILEEALELVRNEYITLGGNDQVAKGSKLLSSILAVL